jgi:YVTN family beta-propeller protein
MRRRILLPLVGLAAVMAALPVSGARAATAAPATVVIAQSDTTVTLPLLSYFQMAVDSVHRHLFFSQGCSCENSILVTSFTGATVATITGQTGVAGIALSPDGSTLYAALTGPDEVTAINTATLKQVAAYHLPAGWTPLSVAVQSGKVWVSYQNAKTLLPAIGYFDPSAAKPVLTTPAAMDDSNTLFDTPPLIAADPTGAGNEVVAVEPGGSFTPTASFDTAGNTVTVRAQSGRLFYGNIPDDCMNAEDVAVVPGGAQFLAACGLPYAQYRYSTADLSEQGYYPTSEYPDAVTVASATGTVAAGVDDQDQPDVYLYAPGSNVPLNRFNAGDGELAPRGLGLSSNASVLFAVSAGPTGLVLNTWVDPTLPKIPPTETTPTPQPQHKAATPTIQTRPAAR